MFKIQEKGKPETAVWLTSDEDLIMSSDGKGDIKLRTNVEKVCKVKIEKNNNKLYLSDVSFNETIRVNGRTLPTGSRVGINHGDQITIGLQHYELINAKQAVAAINPVPSAPVKKQPPWKLKAMGNWLDGQVFTLGTKTVIGRDSSCDITIPGSHLSRKHAVLVTAGNKLNIKDLDSANGTFVNDERVEQAQLKDGDMVRLDILTFHVIAPDERAMPPHMRRTMMTSAITSEQEKAAAGDKSWVTKPTSIGNRENDSLDLLLARHQRNKAIFYAVFGIAFALFAVGSYLVIR